MRTIYEISVMTYKFKSQIKRYEKPGLRLVRFLKKEGLHNENAAIFKTKNRSLAEYILKKSDFHPYDECDFDDHWDHNVIEHIG